MAATYNPTVTDPKDKLRKMVGDTGEGWDPSQATSQTITGAQNTDEEIVGMIAAFGFSEAVAVIALSMASFYAQEPDRITQANGMSVSWGDRVKALQDLAESVRTQPSSSAAKRYPTTTVVDNVPNW